MLVQAHGTVRTAVRNLSILFGDGAGAVVVSAGESPDDGLLDGAWAPTATT